MSASNSVTFNKTDIAKIYQISVQAVTEWVNRGCPTHERQGRELLFHLPDVQRWLTERDTKQVKPKQTNLDLHYERARLAKAQADKAELEVAQLEGQLLDRDKVIHDWQTHITKARTKLLALPARLAVICSGLSTPTEIEQALKAGVYEALDELAADELPDNDEPNLSTDPTALANTTDLNH